MAILQLTEHFNLREFACPCCGRVRVSDIFERHIELLQKMRDELGFGIHVNSGYRCESRNRAVGGASRSWHLIFASDIRPSDNDPEKLKLMHAKAEELGFTGIGTYPTWIHVDLRPEKARWRG